MAPATQVPDPIGRHLLSVSHRLADGSGRGECRVKRETHIQEIMVEQKKLGGGGGKEEFCYTLGVAMREGNVIPSPDYIGDLVF